MGRQYILRKQTYFFGIVALVGMILLAGCAKEIVFHDDSISSYQHKRVNDGPQRRKSDEGVASLLPVE